MSQCHKPTFLALEHQSGRYHSKYLLSVEMLLMKFKNNLFQGFKTKVNNSFVELQNNLPIKIFIIVFEVKNLNYIMACCLLELHLTELFLSVSLSDKYLINFVCVTN